MSLALRSYATTVSQAVSAAQGACASLLDLAVGTPGRAILEAVSGIGLWLQYVALQILTRNRLATSTGTDVDTFIADFGLTRLAGTAATGAVVMTSFSPTSTSALVEPGDIVRTVSGTNYVVTTDTSLATWDNTQGGYVRAAGVSAITVPIAASSAGTASNAAAGAICLLGTSISGIDTVTNTAAITNGTDGETDAAARARFVTWLNTLDRATLASIEGAIEDMATGIFCSGVENVDAAGNLLPGNIVLYVDDGSGDVSDDVLADAYALADSYRASPASIQVVRPAILNPAVSMTLTLASGADASTIESTISTNIAAYFNALAIGDGAVYTKLSQIAYAASPSVTAVSNLLLNGGTSDIAGATGVAIRSGTVTFG